MEQDKPNYYKIHTFEAFPDGKSSSYFEGQESGYTATEAIYKWWLRYQNKIEDAVIHYGGRITYRQGDTHCITTVQLTTN